MAGASENNMKQCPQCRRTYPGDDEFCQEDGTILSPADSPQTIAVPTLQTPPAFAAPQLQINSTAKWVFPVLGLLLGAVVVLSFLVFYGRGERDERAERSNSISKTNENANQIVNAPAANASQNLSNANLSPGGNWSGDLAYPWGTIYSAKVDLTDDGNGKVRGKVIWTLVKTKKTEEIDKIGTTETEYVQGTFDKAAQTVLLIEYDNDNPSNLVNPTKYNLTLSENNSQLKGVVYGKKKRWDFNLRRA